MGDSKSKFNLNPVAISISIFILPVLLLFVNCGTEFESNEFEGIDQINSIDFFNPSGKTIEFEGVLEVLPIDCDEIVDGEVYDSIEDSDDVFPVRAFFRNTSARDIDHKVRKYLVHRNEDGSATSNLFCRDGDVRKINGPLPENCSDIEDGAEYLIDGAHRRVAGTKTGSDGNLKVVDLYRYAFLNISITANCRREVPLPTFRDDMFCDELIVGAEYQTSQATFKIDYIRPFTDNGVTSTQVKRVKFETVQRKSASERFSKFRFCNIRNAPDPVNPTPPPSTPEPPVVVPEEPPAAPEPTFGDWQKRNTPSQVETSCSAHLGFRSFFETWRCNFDNCPAMSGDNTPNIAATQKNQETKVRIAIRCELREMSNIKLCTNNNGEGAPGPFSHIFGSDSKVCQPQEILDPTPPPVAAPEPSRADTITDNRDDNLCDNFPVNTSVIYQGQDRVIASIGGTASHPWLNFNHHVNGTWGVKCKTSNNPPVDLNPPSQPSNPTVSPAPPTSSGANKLVVTQNRSDNSCSKFAKDVEVVLADKPNQPRKLIANTSGDPNYPYWNFNDQVDGVWGVPCDKNK